MSYRDDRRRDYSPRRRSPSPRGYGRRYERSPSPRGRRGRSPGRPHPYDNYRGGRDFGGYRREPRDFPPRRRTPPPRLTEEQRALSTTLFVGNLPYSFREREAGEVFEKFGRLKQVAVGFNRRTGQSKGHAFIEFENKRDAEEAFNEMNGKTIEGRALRIDWDVGLDKKRGEEGGRGRSPRRSPPRVGQAGEEMDRGARRSVTPPRGRTPSPSKASPERKRSPSPTGGVSPDKRAY